MNPKNNKVVKVSLSGGIIGIVALLAISTSNIFAQKTQPVAVGNYSTYSINETDATQVKNGLTIEVDPLNPSDVYKNLVMASANHKSIPDSIVALSNGNVYLKKYFLKYDSINNILDRVFESWERGELISTNKTIFTFTYNSEGKILTETHAEYLNGQWTESSRNTNTYNENSYLLSTIKENYLDSAWYNISKYTYDYDLDGNLITELEMFPFGNDWEEHDKFTYTYDAKGKMLTRLYEIKNLGQYYNMNRNTYTYDANGNLIMTVTESGKMDGTWENYSRNTYTYDINSNVLSDIREYWLNNSWINNWRVTRTYDLNKNLLTYFDEQWEDSAWIKKNKQINTYSTSGYILNVDYFQWSKSSNEWVSIFGHINLADLDKTKYADLDFTIIGEKISIYWKGISTPPTNIAQYFDEKKIISLYPNPSTNYISATNIQDNTVVTIIDLNGKILLSRTIINNQIDISKLSPGVYFLKFPSIDSAFKFIKQ